VVFLDANVFLYAAGHEHPRRAAALRVLGKVEDGTLAANTSLEVVQEILHVLSRRDLRAMAVELAGATLALFPAILPVTREDAEDAVTVFERYSALPARDALHVATMRNNGIDTVVSADSHFDLVEGIRRIDLPPEA
jgi:predicted nucleic acid-binding protein